MNFTDSGNNIIYNKKRIQLKKSWCNYMNVSECKRMLVVIDGGW